MLEALDPTCPIACRDGAVLALGYIFGRRRAELVGLDLERLGDGDGILRRNVQALEVSLMRHKTMTGDGQAKTFLVPRENNELSIAVIELSISVQH